ncbi:MAG: hypothetical protein ACPGKS_03470 [Coraliomargarita sp.]
MVFEDISDGLDLRIRAIDAYTARNSQNNGLNQEGTFGSINLIGGTSTTFEFSLVDANTTDLASVDQVAFSFLDLDGEGVPPYETITISQSSQLVLNSTTSITPTFVDGVVRLDTTVAAGAENNPTSTNLTAGQSTIAASFIFSNTNQFLFTFSAGTTAGATNTTGRNILFAGDVIFDDPDPAIPVPEQSTTSLLLALFAIGTRVAFRRR